ncbi:MAG: hypothetical protein ACP6IU_11345 [Candidatus Asgardarchaeia archaeon]
MKRDMSLFIKGILENVEQAEKLVTGIMFEKFTADEKTIFAVIRYLEITLLLNNLTNHLTINMLLSLLKSNKTFIYY